MKGAAIFSCHNNEYDTMLAAVELSEDFLEKCFHCVQLVRSQVFEEKKMIDLDQQLKRLEVLPSQETNETLILKKS